MWRPVRAVSHAVMSSTMTTPQTTGMVSITQRHVPLYSHDMTHLKRRQRESLSFSSGCLTDLQSVQEALNRTKWSHIKYVEMSDIGAVSVSIWRFGAYKPYKLAGTIVNSRRVWLNAHGAECAAYLMKHCPKHVIPVPLQLPFSNQASSVSSFLCKLMVCSVAVRYSEIQVPE